MNFASNRLAMLKSVHFASWANVKLLNLQDNNLTSIGAYAKLEEPPLLKPALRHAHSGGAGPHRPRAPQESHRQRTRRLLCGDTGLERFSVWGTAHCSARVAPRCSKLIGVQAQSKVDLPEGRGPPARDALRAGHAGHRATPLAQRCARAST